jgi:hypothetical protein
MMFSRIVDQRNIAVLIQLADTAASALERGDFATLERALKGISKLRDVCFNRQQYLQSLFRLHEIRNQSAGNP